MGSARAHFNWWAALVVPGLVFLAVFYLTPLVGMAVRSFTDPGPGNYATFVESGIYLRVLWTTIRTALIATVVCLLLGYPYAYVMLKSGPKLTAVLSALVLLPFWSSILVRTYAWTVILQDNGIINSALKSLGVIDESLPLMRNTLGVTIGMTQILLPFLVFPVYAVMKRIDPDLLPAAEGLGARPYRAFFRVFFPITLPGVLSGCLLVFVLSLGFYITPALLGSPSNTMYSVLVADMVSTQLKFGVASALSIILLLVTLVLLWIGTRVVRLGDILGYSADQ
jgi:putative spermidine/putrescine transport system permease protein